MVVVVVLKEDGVEVRERVQDWAQQSTEAWARAPGRQGTPQGPGRAQRRGRDGSCMTFSGVAANLPGDARAAGLIVAIRSTRSGWVEYMERSCNYVHEDDQQVCETTCLDIVGGLVEEGWMGGQQRRSWKAWDGTGIECQKTEVHG